MEQLRHHVVERSQRNLRNTTLGVMEAVDYKAIYGVKATFSGHSIDTTAVLMKYTYYGDADFNGQVNFDDYAAWTTGFSTAARVGSTAISTVTAWSTSTTTH